ncbi:MAG: hypothetical protein H8K07_14585, partial [Nitrospira sp.]|nr:hypothetical protein [Nitrospira sp.]
MPQSSHNNWTISSVKSGHLTSVICGQPTSVLTLMLRHPTLAALEPLKLTGMATALAEQLEMPDIQR